MVEKNLIKMTTLLCIVAVVLEVLKHEKKLYAMATKNFSTKGPSAMSRNLNYEQLNALIKEDKIVLIDVRQAREIKETGALPGSHNVPIEELEFALKLDPVEFEDRYNFPKPDYDQEIVFSCRSGRRSLVALENALSVGYKNAKHYTGGWLDWEKHQK
uniref:Rhodanese domain-containing protein n=1 Tax=Clastoptera arizonana TaxID=38151 RepID=A0A1B6CXZ7_9HEMI